MSIKQFTTGETVITTGMYECARTHIVRHYNKGDVFSPDPKANFATNWILLEK